MVRGQVNPIISIITDNNNKNNNNNNNNNYNNCSLLLLLRMFYDFIMYIRATRKAATRITENNVLSIYFQHLGVT